MTLATLPARSTTTRTVRRAGLVGVVLATAFLLTSCMSTQQETAFGLVNDSRAAAGLSALQHDPNAHVKAQAWAEHLAASGSLAHSNLTSGMNPGWTRVTENVGYSGSIEAVHAEFMKSSTHRNNILDRGMTHLGVGVARGNGHTFVVHVFSQR